MTTHERNKRLALIKRRHRVWLTKQASDEKKVILDETTEVVAGDQMLDDLPDLV